MSLIDLLTEKSRKVDDIPRAEVQESTVTEQGTAETTVFSTTVSKNTDLLKVKDQLYNDNLVFVELVNEDYALDRERVFNELKTTVDDINGDIALLDENTVIVTPQSIEVSREEL